MEIIKQKENINKMINDASNIFIMGHNYLDLDAIGSCIGICEYVKGKNKRATLVINDNRLEKGVKKILDKVGNTYNIKKSSKIKEKINDKSLLIVVDTNKGYLLQDKNALNLFKNVLVIDHHDTNQDSIKNGLVIIDREASSTCEMITDLLDKENIKVDKDVATYILSGIVLDTNNYVLKTTSNTFRTSYILTEWGADPSYVQYLLKQDIKKYVERQKVITNIKQIKNIALSTCKSSIIYRREDLAKIADTLLQFDKIEASFVIGKLDKDTVGISSRSSGKINVGKILENLNGGGNENEAGAAIKNTTIKKVDEELKNIIKSLN